MANPQNENRSDDPYIRRNIFPIPDRPSVAEALSNTVVGRQLSKLGQNWGWFMAAGIGYFLCGIMALNWPVGSTLGVTFALGVLFTLSGIVQVVQAFRFRKEAGVGWQVLQAITALAAGVLMLRYPGAGMTGVAIAMAFYFILAGAAKTVLAFGMRPHKGWGWALASAVCSVLLGSYIIGTFPVSALWVPGLLLGVDFIVHGSSLIGFSLALKNVHRRIRTMGDLEDQTKKAA